MQSVRVLARITGSDPRTTFARVADFERYPALVDTVESVKVASGDDRSRLSSDWVVHFRNGLLKWTEDDLLDAGAGTISFAQTSGDFDTFTGTWVLSPDGADTVVEFRATFDFGVPSLESIIDPVAVRVLTETIQGTLRGLFEGRASFEATASTLDRTGAMECGA